MGCQKAAISIRLNISYAINGKWNANEKITSGYKLKELKQWIFYLIVK